MESSESSTRMASIALSRRRESCSSPRRRSLGRPQPPVLGHRPFRKKLEDVEQLRFARHRPGVEHREVAEEGAVDVEQRHPHIAHRVETGKIGVGRKKLDDLVREVGQTLFLDYRLARCARDVVLVVFDVLAVDPERQRTQPPVLGIDLGDPGAGGVESPAEIFDQGPEELDPGGRNRARDDEAQRLVRLQESFGSRTGMRHGVLCR